MSHKEATIGDNERAELEAIVAEARASARRRIDDHAVDCAYRARGYKCTCAVAYGSVPSEGPEHG
jgi:hypothetical protein